MVIGADSCALTLGDMTAMNTMMFNAIWGIRDMESTRFTPERYIATMPRCVPRAINLSVLPRAAGRLIFPLFTAAILLLSACTTPPGITVTAVDVVEVGDTDTQVAIRVLLSNSTKVSIRIDTWKYSIRVRNNQVYSGEWVSAITIPPESRLLTAIPAVIALPNQPGSDSPWSVDGTVRYLEPTRFSQLLYDLGLSRPTASFNSSGAGMGSGGTIPSAG